MASDHISNDIHNDPMLVHTLDFSWEVHLSGYKWVFPRPDAPAISAASPITHYLEPESPYLEPVDPSAGTRVTHPLIDTPELFSRFADVWPERDRTLEFANRVLEFANSFGCLGAIPVHNELKNWTRNFRMMRVALSLWRTITQREPDDIVWAEWLAGARDELNEVPGRRLPPRSMPEDSLQAAVRMLESIVKMARPAIYPDYERAASGTGFRIKLCPASLADAMWLQFCRTLDQTRITIDCEGCGEVKTIEARTSRSDRRYCNHNCKMRAYRLRKKAQRLRSEGFKIADISKRIGRSERVVRTWLKGGKRGNKKARG